MSMKEKSNERIKNDRTMTEAKKTRVKKYGEVFTPPSLVRQMLSKLPREVWKKGKTFLDPACGNGNFLVHVLYRKLCRNHNPLEALRCTFGVDIMRDSIQECRERLLLVIHLVHPDLEITEDYAKVALTNIRWINAKKPGCENGSLDYEFDFKPNFNQEGVNRLMNRIQIRLERGELNCMDVEETDCRPKSIFT